MKERDGKATKVPITPGTGAFASSTDSETWCDFESVLEYVDIGGADGVGFVFTEDDEVVGVDLDDCRDPETGDVDDAARDIIERLDSYTEMSPSGMGFHVLVEGELPEGRNRRGWVELYETARFFTVSGEHVEETPTHIARRQDALVTIHREYVHDEETSTDGISDEEDDENRTVTATKGVTVTLEDDELLRKARNASNGEKFERLWSGDITGYDSQSEADMALCCLLAFWTGGDLTQLDRLFRESGLHRDKWDEVHYADGSTYGEKTVLRAIAATSEFYDPETEQASTEPPVTEPSVGSQSNAGSAAKTDFDQRHTYLTEKNRLLTDRVSELEEALEQKKQRIDILEGKVERLDNKLSEQESESHSSPETYHREDRESVDNSTVSPLERAQQLFGRDGE